MANFISENSTVNLSKLKSYLRVDNDAYDVGLKFILAAVKNKADEYCNRSNWSRWNDEVPPLVELWILRTVDAIYQRPNMHSTRQDIWEQGADYWEYDWDTAVEDLAPFRRYPGFA